MSDPAIVTVPGIGNVLNHYEGSTSKINYYVEGSANDYDESQVVLQCAQENEWMSFDDQVKVSWKLEGVRFTVDVRSTASDVPVNIFRKGTIRFTYDSVAKKWSMHGLPLDMLVKSGIYGFCGNDGSVTGLRLGIGGLECFNKSGESEDAKVSQSIDLIVKSISGQAEQIIQNAHRYPDKASCKDQFGVGDWAEDRGNITDAPMD